MRTRPRWMLLLAVFLLVGWSGRERQEQEPSPPPLREESAADLTEEDWEVVARMELLALIDFLRDMELLETLEAEQ